MGLGCLAVLGGILVAGLWPFHSPKNRVTWLTRENGLRFANPGTIVGTAEFQPIRPGAVSCSVEVWTEPARQSDSNTLVAFHSARHPVQLALEQSGSGLNVNLNAEPRPYRRQPPVLYIDHAFHSGRPLFITISSGAQGTAVYIDGMLVRAARGYRIAASDCSGRLVVGTSPVGNAPWTGRLRGLAVYYQELTPEEVSRHYSAWTGQGRPVVAAGERCAALYLFDEHRGSLVHNQVGAGPNLLIPQRYRIEDQEFLTPFWQGFDPPDILLNIAGFMPFGALFYAYFSLRPSARRTAMTITVLGGLVSVLIEVLQVCLPTRQSDTTDIITNIFGTWLGVVLCHRFQPGIAQTLRRFSRWNREIRAA